MERLTEEAVLRRVVAEYQKKGYEVTIRPTADKLPWFLKGESPDLIAVRGDDRVVLEVKGGSELVGARDLVSISEAVEAQPGWRFELRVAPLSRPQAASARPISMDEVLMRLESARLALDNKDPGGAVVLAWIAAEGVLREIARRVDLQLETNSRAFLTKQLFALGHLNRLDFDLLQRTLQLRNSVAHGTRSERPAPRTVASLIKTTERLARALAPATMPSRKRG